MKEGRLYQGEATQRQLPCPGCSGHKEDCSLSLFVLNYIKSYSINQMLCSTTISPGPNLVLST